MGYSPWGHKESDTTERLHFSGLPWWLRWERMCLQHRRPEFDPWVGKIPWRRACQPTPGFLPRESPWTKEPGRLVHGVAKSRT